MAVNSVFTANNNSNLYIGSNTLTLAGTITGNGTLSGTTSSDLTIGGSATSLGTLTFKAGYQTLNSVTLNRTSVGAIMQLHWAVIFR
jgi:hypothetical protein